MLVKNPNSKRENAFRSIYDDVGFQLVCQRKDNLPNFPYIVDVELTNHCNLKCIFCAGQNAMTREKGFISEKLLMKAVDECSLFNTPIRFIRWGEPFLHPKIISFIEYVKSRGLLLHITNNGQIMKENHMKALVEHKVDSIIFSFQGATKDRYELMRNNENYNILCKNILKLIDIRGDKEKPFIQISCTMTDESKEEIKDFVNYWQNIVDFIGIGKTNLSRLHALKPELFIASNGLMNLINKETIKKAYRPCDEVYQKLSVDWDGKVTCCCDDFDNFLTIGDLNKSTIFDIWNNNRKLNIFRELLDDNMQRSLSLCNTCYHTYEEF